MTWTQRMIAKLTAEAEKIWPALVKATGAFKEERESRYNRLMFAVRYLETR